MCAIEYTNGILSIKGHIHHENIQLTILLDDDDIDVLFDELHEDGERSAKLSVHFDEGPHIVSTPFGSSIIEVRYDDVFCVAGGTLPNSPVVFFKKPEPTMSFDPRVIFEPLDSYNGTRAERLFVVTVTKADDFIQDGQHLDFNIERIFPFPIERGSCSILSRGSNIRFRVELGSLSVVSKPLQYNVLSERELVTDCVPPVNESLLTQIRAFDWKTSDVFRYLHGIERFIKSADAVKVLFHLPNVNVVGETSEQITVKLNEKEGWSYLVEGRPARTQTVSVDAGDKKRIVMVHDESGVTSDNINVAFRGKAKQKEHMVSEQTKAVSVAIAAFSFLTLAIVAA